MKSGKTTEEETTIQYILQAHKILMTSHGTVDGRAWYNAQGLMYHWK
jgi:hypothetical protein